MSEQNGSPVRAARPAPRWLWPALIISLALNLLIVGAAAGFAYRHKDHLGGRHAPRGIVGYVERVLPANRLAELQPKIDQFRQALKAMRVARRKARDSAAQTLAAEPFDKEKYAQALAGQLDAEVALRKAVHHLFVDAAAGFSAEERRQFVAWSAQQRKDGGRGHRRRHQR